MRPQTHWTSNLPTIFLLALALFVVANNAGWIVRVAFSRRKLFCPSGDDIIGKYMLEQGCFDEEGKQMGSDI